MVNPVNDGCLEQLFRVGVWVVGAVLLIGIAVMLWHRRPHHVIS